MAKKRPPRFAYDVIISYSSRDQDWVRGELLSHIEQAGLKAFIDFRDFTRGAPSIKECERRVVDCRKMLVVLAPNYLKSGWAEFENVMVETLVVIQEGPYATSSSATVESGSAISSSEARSARTPKNATTTTATSKIVAARRSP